MKGAITVSSTDAESREMVKAECQSRKYCRGCRFYHYPLFPVGDEDKEERCSQWDIIENWRTKRERTKRRG